MVVVQNSKSKSTNVIEIPQNYYERVMPLLFSHAQHCSVKLIAAHYLVSVRDHLYCEPSVTITTHNQLTSLLASKNDTSSTLVGSSNNRMIFILTAQQATKFSSITKMAQELRKLLERVGLTSFIMTAAHHGLYIIVPLKALYNPEIMYATTQKLAIFMATKFPSLIALEPSAYKKCKKVLLDVSANLAGSSTVMPYSLVTTDKKMSVALPCSWDYIDKISSGYFFSPAKALLQVEEYNDAWGDIQFYQNDLPTSLISFS